MPEPLAMRPLTAGTLRLEPQTAAHAEAMFVVLSDPAIYLHENAPPESQEWLLQRYTRLETRQSADGEQQWLNWVVRLPNDELAGYVQATLRRDASAAIAYEFASAYWGRGIGHAATLAMIEELHTQYGVQRLDATLKRSNARSLRLLQRLQFSSATEAQARRLEIEVDEWLLVRELSRVW